MNHSIKVFGIIGLFVVTSLSFADGFGISGQQTITGASLIPQGNASTGPTSSTVNQLFSSDGAPAATTSRDSANYI